MTQSRRETRTQIEFRESHLRLRQKDGTRNQTSDSKSLESNNLLVHTNM